MSLSQIVYFLFIFYWTGSALAFKDFPLDITDFCLEIQSQKLNFHRPRAGQILKEGLKLTLIPGKLVHLEEHEIEPIPAEIVKIGSAQQSQVLRNLIFSVDPPVELTHSPEAAKIQTRYQQINRRLSKLKSDLSFIVFASTVEQCIARVGEVRFDLESYLNLLSERTSLHWIEQMREAVTVEKILTKLVPRLKLKWDVIHVTDLMALHRALRSPDIGNVVLIAHGLSEGKMVDSWMSEYPLGVFTDLSASLQSLTFFACHGDRIAQTYQLEKNLASLPFNGAVRKLFVSRGTSIPGMGEGVTRGAAELVPIRSFNAFMRKVDRNLAKSAVEKQGLFNQESPPFNCTVILNGFVVTIGTFGLNLNGHFVGTIRKNLNDNEHSAETAFDFPCSYVDRKLNILTLHGISLIETSRIQSSQFQVNVRALGKAPKMTRLTHYFRDDHGYQSSKFEFLSN